MFLEPDPRPAKNTMSSGFFSSQTPVASPRDARSAKRKPLHERTKSQNNQQNPKSSPEKPTVRLVKPSPVPDSPSTKTIVSGDDNGQENKDTIQEKPLRWPQLGDVEKDASVSDPGFGASKQEFGVSGVPTPTNGLRRDERPANTAPPQDDASRFQRKAPWHRRSLSSGNYSESSTLKESEKSFTQRSDRSQRLSDGTTLRDTPTPSERETRAHADEEEDEEDLSLLPPQGLDALPETSPERSTIRAISSSPTSDSRPDSAPSDSSSSTRPRSLPSGSDQPTAISRANSRRTISVDSIHPLPQQFHIRSAGVSPSSFHQSQESFTQSDATPIPASSPNFIAYSPESLRPHSRSNPLRYTASIESIPARLQYPSVVRPPTGQSLATSSSWESSNDTVPPLQVARKRLRRKAGSDSLGAHTSSWNASNSRMLESEEVDTYPYPRQPFNRHLSTIASESDRPSRTTSQQLSQFSIGSGVWTLDDVTIVSASRSTRRRQSGRTQLSLSEPASPIRPTSSLAEEEVGDMTLGIFREESAKPQPLFRANPTMMMVPGRSGERQLPPIPPMPANRESEEHIDTLFPLQSPPLRQTRSGYSLRNRSNSVPSTRHSRQVSQISSVDSDRWSQNGSIVFPTWAKRFYSGNAALSSKVSLNSLSTAGTRPPTRAIDDNLWYERTLPSRTGTGYSHLEVESSTSSAFLPSIFRPRSRVPDKRRSKNIRSSKRRKARRSRPSPHRDSPPDSLAISIAPLPRSRDENGNEILASGQPRYGMLKDNDNDDDDEIQPYPSSTSRRYNQQKEWGTMEFPRSTTHDHAMTAMGMPTPHLMPSKRHSQNQLSNWRAPSFVESLDTLVRSRCNRQILLFALGFLCPLLWMVAAFLPLPKRPASPEELNQSLQGSTEDVQAAMMKHEIGDYEKRWRDERTFWKAWWWRMLNRVMSVVGLVVIGIVVSISFFFF